jgi:hypothetical protein
MSPKALQPSPDTAEDPGRGVRRIWGCLFGIEPGLVATIKPVAGATPNNARHRNGSKTKPNQRLKQLAI